MTKTKTTALLSLPSIVSTLSIVGILSYQPTPSCSFHSPPQFNRSTLSHLHRQQYHDQITAATTIIRPVSIQSEFDRSDDKTAYGIDGDISLGEKVRTVTVTYMDKFSQSINSQSEDKEEELDEQGAKKVQRERMVLDVVDGRPTFSYEITLPIVGTANTATTEVTPTNGDQTVAPVMDLYQTLGCTMNEIQQNADGMVTFSESGLEMDSLRYISLEEQTLTDQKLGLSFSFDEEGMDGTIQLIDEKKNSSINSSQGGVVVSRIVRGGLAWKAGVRAGDRIVATSATMGDVSFPLHECI